MTQESLYFFDNGLEPGGPVPGKGRVPQRRGLFYAWQLINAGFFCKRRGQMPASLCVSHLQRTADEWLSVRPGIEPEWEPFDESVFLRRIREWLVPLWTGRERLPAGKGLSDVLMNYPHALTRFFDDLDRSDRTLVQAKWELAPHLDPLPDNWRLLFLPCPQMHVPDRAGLTVVPAVPAVYSQIRMLTGRVPVVSQDTIPLPFSAYDRLAVDHPYLGLPVHGPDQLPAPDRLRRRILAALKKQPLPSSSLVVGVPDTIMDSYSLELLSWLTGHLPLHVLILARDLFDVRWTSRAGRQVEIWNPVTPDRFQLNSGVVPPFRVAGLEGEIRRRSCGRVGLALYLLCRDHPTASGRIGGELSLQDRYRLGLVDDDNQPLPREPEPLTGLVEALSHSLDRGESVLAGEMKKLVRHPDRFRFRDWLEAHSVSGPVAAMLLIAAGQWEHAAEQFLAAPVPEGLLPWASRALLVAGRAESMDQLGPGIRQTSAWLFVRAQAGEPCDPARLDWPERFELRLMRDDGDALAMDLAEYRERFGEDALYLEMAGVAQMGTDPDETIRRLLQAASTADEQGDLFRKAMVLKRLGNTWFRLGDFRSAESCYLEAMTIQADLGNRHQYEAIAYNRAMVDLNLCRLDRAEDVIQADLARNRRLGNRLFQVFNLKALAKSAAFRFHFLRACELLDQAWALAVEGEFQSELPGILYIRASALLEMGRYPDAEACIHDLADRVTGQVGWETQLRFLRADLARRRGDSAAAESELAALFRLELDTDDALYRDVLDALIHHRSLAEATDLYGDLGRARLVQLQMFGRTWLLERYPALAYTIEREMIESDLALAASFNQHFAAVFRRYLSVQSRGMADPTLFEDLSRLLRQAIGRESTSFARTLSDIGQRAGVRGLQAWPGGREQEVASVTYRDTDGRICLTMEDEPDEKLDAFFRFLADMIAAIGLPRIGKAMEPAGEDGCPYLSLIIGRSPEIQVLKQQVRQASGFSFPVLIQGESGTGKELAARAVHYCSDRRNRPFVAINCAALPENLIESELFGTARGAFTGATVSRSGLFESAGEGTIFLDEVGELPLTTQAKLLRVLQEREYYRLGETRPRTVRARFVFATNRDLGAAVKAGEFREDLFYRIAGLRLTVPSLNDRRTDIPLLARHFLSTMEGGEGKHLAPETLAILERHTYRGNIRELQNLIMGAIIHAGDQVEIRPEHLPETLRPAPVSYSGKLKQATRSFQRQYIRQVLEQTGYNHSETARILGITRQRVIQLRKELDIQS